ncbi:polyketide synthase [Kitasatospora sp. MMS16-BH015]|uniref:fatty acyl-AMP ligase n=1 Tax=Kitasatospora sp. MMS16-BH015 TaxID=2018025 RepID=UPI000CA11D28|nr:fatty acyl-AMP ligase [Kitasatospora sp. MMS16-BH015]AUG78811.1 polyketide synthase [Kitasatospora sp. MMS16-BH015]
MTGFETFTELVLHRTADLGEKDAFIFLHDNAAGTGAEHLTYNGLDAEAKRIASWLQAQGAEGGQVLLLYPSSADFVKAFTACLYAGSVAVPAPLPGDQGHHFARVSGILRDAEVKAVLTDSANEPNISAWLREAGFTDINCLATDRPGEGDPSAWTAPKLTPESLAFLQYTSGSTSSPKGVMVSHFNLLSNEYAIQRSTSSDENSRLGGWLPFYHDMGLIGHILQPLWLGGSAALMSPVSFLKRPFRWLQMIDQYKVTIGGGPNFAFDLCTRRVTDEQLATLDLSSWKVACNGAEPVRAETIRAFTERFEPAGFTPEAFFPCYGMAETTLLVSGTPYGQKPVIRSADIAALELGTLREPAEGAPARTLVSSGVFQDFDVRIVDPQEHTERPEGGVGEIWVKGDSVAGGYWKRPETNAEIFQAVILGGEQGPDAGWLRTGDLGVLESGQLYVTGRLKEMILINGRNIYPHDVERTVQALDPALAPGNGAVFSVDTGEEHLVIVQEIKPNSPSAADLPALAAQVRTLISKEFTVAGSVVLVKPGTIRKTTSGKLQRTLMRQLLIEGKLTPLHEVLEDGVKALVDAAALASVG